MLCKRVSQHHFVSLCPGLVKTDMQREIKNINPIEFPDVLGIQELFESMPLANEVAALFIKKLAKIEEIQSGKFIRLNDI